MAGQRATLPSVRMRPWNSLPAVVAALALASALGCDRNTERFVEGEQPRPPDLARIFPESEGAPMGGGAPPMAGAQRAGMPPAASPAPPAQRPAAPVAAAGASISGTIRVAPELEASLPAQGMLFVVARPFGVNAGPPMAVLRIPSPHFPVSFEIGPEQVMIPSMRFEGNIGISARLDGDGNAMTRQPGDVQGATSEPLQPGASGVTIVLDQKL